MLDSDNCRSDMTNRRTRRQESRGTNVARILSAAETLCAIYGSGKTNLRVITLGAESHQELPFQALAPRRSNPRKLVSIVTLELSPLPM